MQIDGILSIQAGENPRIVREKLSAYLPPSEIKSEEENAKGKAQSKKPAPGNAEKVGA
jgi:chemotaxis protein MotA